MDSKFPQDCSIAKTASITGAIPAGSFVKPCQPSFVRQLFRYSHVIPSA